MFRKFMCLIVLYLTFFGMQSVFAGDIRVGVVASRGAVKANVQWAEFATYLEQATGSKVLLVPVAPNKIVQAVAAGEVDYALGNPVNALTLQEKHGATPLATMNRKSGAEFAGVIIAKKGSGIKTAKDLVGKKVMGFKFGQSAAAYVFQVYHMRREGVDPHKDFASFTEAKQQDDIVLAVKAGSIDGGFIKSGLLESMQAEGKINIEDFEIVDQKSGDNLKQVHSTRVYPEWFFVSAKTNDSAVADKIKSALLKLDANSPAAQNAEIKGFIEPMDLEGLKETLRSLKLEPYNS